MIKLQEFLELPRVEISKLVRQSGSKVLVFPINGTRRWFAMEHGDQEFSDPITAYMDIAQTRHIEIYKMIYEHGVDTLISPMVGPEILATRDEYMDKIGGDGLARLARHEEFLEFYEKYGVRVHFYGDFRERFKDTYFEYLLELFESISEKTKNNSKFRMFYGLFADNLNSTNRVSDYSVKYFKEHGRIPTREEIVSMYYGEYVDKADIFIGFDRFAAFDYPLLSWGEEDMYFTTAPSLYLDDKELREILYDHIYTRRAKEIEYMSEEDALINPVKDFYQMNRSTVLGVGRLLHGTWIPRLGGE